MVLTFSKRRLKLFWSVRVLTPTKEDKDDKPTSVRKAEIFVISFENVENTAPNVVLIVENMIGTKVERDDKPGPA